MPKDIGRRELLAGSIAMSLGVSGAGSAFAAPDENPFPPKKIEYTDPVRYSPLAYIESEIPSSPEMAFNASTTAEAGRWRRDLRTRLWSLLGESHTPGPFTGAVTRISAERMDGYTREKWEMEVVPGRWMPFYVLRPAGASSPVKTVLCLHGHGNGARDIINQPVNSEAAELIGILNTDYALQAVRRGWCAVAPELFTFGERVDLVEDARPGFDGGCEKPSLNAMQIGKTLIGIRTKDICTLIDWMTMQEDMDCRELPCVGLSGGGMMTMYTTALDDRIRRACIAGYLTEARDSIMAIRHCSCNYVPGLLTVADFPDIAAMIAPRFLIAQNGSRDAIFPIESVRRAMMKVERAYDVYGARDKVRLDVHDGFHSFWSPSLDDLLA